MRTRKSICRQNGGCWGTTWRNLSRQKDTQPWRTGRECGGHCLRRVQSSAAFKLFRGSTPFQHISSLLPLQGVRRVGRLVFRWAKRSSIIKISYQSMMMLALAVQNSVVSFPGGRYTFDTPQTGSSSCCRLLLRIDTS